MKKEKTIEIEWKKCKNCGFLQHKTHLRCLKCKNTTFSEVYPSGLGILLSYTILKAPPMEFREMESYALGIVEFDNGVKAMGQIATENNLQMGMKLKPVISQTCYNLDGEKVKTYLFEPI